MGMVAQRSGSVRLRGAGHLAPGAARHRPRGPGLRARGPPHLHRPDGAGEPGGRPPGAAQQLPDGAEPWTPERLFSCSPTWARCPPPRRPHERRRAADADRGAHADGQPLLVLLDEPSEGVAPVIVEGMVGMIHRAQGRGVSILLSEQNLHFAELVSDRAYVLEKGQIRWQGTMRRARRRRRGAARLPVDVRAGRPGGAAAFGGPTWPVPTTACAAIRGPRVTRAVATKGRCGIETGQSRDATHRTAVPGPPVSFDGMV
jgi:hypothetical protein